MRLVAYKHAAEHTHTFYVFKAFRWPFCSRRPYLGHGGWKERTNTAFLRKRALRKDVSTVACKWVSRSHILPHVLRRPSAIQIPRLLGYPCHFDANLVISRPRTLTFNHAARGSYPASSDALPQYIRLVQGPQAPTAFVTTCQQTKSARRHSAETQHQGLSGSVDRLGKKSFFPPSALLHSHVKTSAVIFFMNGYSNASLTYLFHSTMN